jgi:hypothetical protein
VLAPHEHQDNTRCCVPVGLRADSGLPLRGALTVSAA